MSATPKERMEGSKGGTAREGGRRRGGRDRDRDRCGGNLSRPLPGRLRKHRGREGGKSVRARDREGQLQHSACWVEYKHSTQSSCGTAQGLHEIKPSTLWHRQERVLGKELLLKEGESVSFNRMDSHVT